MTMCIHLTEIWLERSSSGFPCVYVGASIWIYISWCFMLLCSLQPFWDVCLRPDRCFSPSQTPAPPHRKPSAVSPLRHGCPSQQSIADSPRFICSLLVKKTLTAFVCCASALVSEHCGCSRWCSSRWARCRCALKWCLTTAPIWLGDMLCNIWAKNTH